MALKSKIIFVVPDNLQKELRERIVKDGYGLRGKSLWVSEAIERLLNMKDFPELVNYSDQMYGFGKVETVVLDYSIKKMIEIAIIEIRKKFPLLEGLKSQIARTAIIQRLIRS